MKRNPIFPLSARDGFTIRKNSSLEKSDGNLIVRCAPVTQLSLSVAGFPYIVNGVGGNTLYELGEPLPESVVRHTDVHGVVLVTATSSELVTQFLDANGDELDRLRLTK